MLEILHKAIHQLPDLLKQFLKWQSLDIDYHDPRVERLWMPYDNSRIMLHCIHPCKSEDALFHRHPWPSAMRIIQGRYEMAVGYGTTAEPPPVAAKMILYPGSEYEMTEPNGWHYVRPLDGCVYTIMVTGKPWKNDSPRSTKPLIELSEKRKEEIIKVFYDDLLIYM